MEKHRKNDKTRNRKSIVISVLLAFMMLLVVGCDGNGTDTGTGNNSLIDHLTLGERFLLELEYEQALFHFLALIEIEPLNPRGYTGAAQAHIGLGQFDEAIAILQQGLEVLPDNAEILDMLSELQGTSHMSHDFTSEQAELMRQLFAALKSGNFSAAGAIVNSDAYRQLVEKANIDGIVIHQNEETSLAIHPNGNVYAGDIVNGSREGFGIWFSGTSDAFQYMYFQGQWANDLPNGEGRYVGRGGMEDFWYFSDEGTFINGYHHGVHSVTLSRKDGGICFFRLTFEFGVEQTKGMAYDPYLMAFCESCGDVCMYSYSGAIWGVFGL